MTETDLKDDQASPKEPPEPETTSAKPSNPIWTYISFVFLIIITLGMSHSLYELFYGTPEDQQLSADLEEAFEQNSIQLDLLDARIRTELLSQFDASKRETIVRAFAKLASRPNKKDLSQNQRLIYQNARQKVLSEAETLLKDGQLSKLEKMSFVGLLETALDRPERLLEKLEEDGKKEKKAD
ncbi:MAG: hypothetical protein P1V97_14805 [Planctomycetota bacterium]|nr:hypothetical protein [Planctomycetota bacterium]